MGINRSATELAIVAHLACAGLVSSQGTIHTVGRTISEVGTLVYMVGDRGSGVSMQAVNQKGRFVSARWRPGEGITTIPYLPNSTTVSPGGSSPNLDYLSSSHSGLGTNRPAYWSRAAGLIEVPLPDASPGEDRGFIYDISANGIAACRVWVEGVANSTEGVTRPALFHPAIGRIDIPAPEQFSGVVPWTISRDGTTLAGPAGGYPWRWTEATGFEFDTDFPIRTSDDVSLENPLRNLTSNTPDGLYYVGSVQYTDPDANPPFGITYTRTFIWKWGTGLKELPAPPLYDANLHGSVLYRGQVSEDARRILVEGSTLFERSEWIYENPLDDFAPPVRAMDFFEANGVDLTGWTNFRVQRMSRDGTSFGGQGRLDGVTYLWMIYIPPECPADVNHDGELTPADFQAWVDAYFENRIVADQNLDVYITPSDFNAWILNYNNAIANGCP
jgi:hypothetical protein